MQQFKIFIELTRLNKPIGFMLLFWPCAWGLAYAYSGEKNLTLFFYYLFLFFTGSVLMRSAGCIFNDIVDKDFDKKVNRTKNRPIPTGMISVKRALVYVFILCLVAFFVLMQFNPLTIILGISSMLLAFSYPFMKRITYWPQLFLGITFNWGILMAWTAVTNNISHDIIILYLSAIFWTLGYDTIYGAQDMSDDEIIGLKSTSIKFKKNIKMFVSIAYILTIILMSYLFTSTIGINISSLFFLLFIVILIYQVKRLNKNDPKICLRLFKINNLAGLIMFLSIFSGNL
jgi:4-hydroxybenzoate polyprenyltransferase